MSNGITARTLCVIAPTDADADECRQVAGLVVTTVKSTRPGVWEVAPAPVVTFDYPTRTANGFMYPAGAKWKCAIPEQWLRPIRGERQQNRTDTPIDAKTPA